MGGGQEVTVRPAEAADAAAMAGLLNAIIALGGTTAHEDPFTPEAMRAGYVAGARTLCCTVAETDGKIAGFQHLGWPAPGDLPEGWTAIASFVQPGMAGRGIGRALFAATLLAAEAAGVRTIDATIRADNASGLGYYGSIGFRDHDVIRAVPLRSGQPVDRIRKRYDLGA